MRFVNLFGSSRAGLLGHYLGSATSNPAGSIYGTVVATSVITIEGAESPSLVDLVSTDLLTVLVYWAAHVYASVVADHDTDDAPLVPWRRAVDAMSHEWSLVAGSFLPLLAVLLAAPFVADVATAALVGQVTGVLLLFGWGFAASRAGGWSRRASVGYGLVAAAFGVVVISMRFLLH